MRGVDHYIRAAEMVADVENATVAKGEEATYLATAQAHATLALAGATALATYCRVEGSEGELADWEHAAGGDDDA